MVIVDTGFWLALADDSDEHHRTATQFLTNLRTDLITTWPVMTETSHLLYRVGRGAHIRFIDSFRTQALQIFDIRKEHLSRLGELMRKYIDLPMDLADASLVLLAEEIDSGDILSTNVRDFKTYRWKNRRPFNNLLA